jgi:hypothetical protein
MQRLEGKYCGGVKWWRHQLERGVELHFHQMCTSPNTAVQGPESYGVVCISERNANKKRLERKELKAFVSKYDCLADFAAGRCAVIKINVTRNIRLYFILIKP